MWRAYLFLDTRQPVQAAGRKADFDAGCIYLAGAAGCTRVADVTKLLEFPPRAQVPTLPELGVCA